MGIESGRMRHSDTNNDSTDDFDYQELTSRRFDRLPFLFGVDKIIEYLQSFTIQFPGDTEADRLEAIVRAKHLKLILAKVEKEIDSNLDDNMQLQGRHNLVQNFHAGYQELAFTIDSALDYLIWARSQPNWSTVQLVAHWDGGKPRVMGLKDMVIRFGQAVIELNDTYYCKEIHPSGSITPREHQPVLTAIESRAAMDERHQARRTVDGFGKTIAAAHSSLSPDSRQALTKWTNTLIDNGAQWLCDHLKSSSQSQTEQGIQSLTMIPSSETPTNPVTPGPEALKLGCNSSFCRPSPRSRELIRQRGAWYELKPGTSYTSGLYQRCANPPMEGVPFQDRDDEPDMESSPEVSPDPSPTRRKAMKLPKITAMQESPVSVLVVDDFHHDRSVFLHALLERLRISIFGSLKKWPFDCVDSAGLYVATSFSKPYLKKIAPAQSQPTRRNEVIDRVFKPIVTAALLAQGSEEEKVVRSQLRCPPRGVTAEDLDGYDCILCFDAEQHDILRKMQASRSHQAFSEPAAMQGRCCQIVMLSSRSVQSISPPIIKDCGLSAVPDWDMNLCLDLSESFLAPKLGWFKPGWDSRSGFGPLASNHNGREWGTMRFGLPKRYVLDLTSPFWSGRLWRVQNETDCEVHAGKLDMADCAWICGPRVNHQRAKDMVEDWICEQASGEPVAVI